MPFRELAFFPTEGCEFFVTLGREGKGPAMDRQQMLERAHVERCCEAPEFGTQHSLRRSDLGLSPRLPLRYRLADRVVGTLKRGLGPLYATLRSGLSRAGSVYRVFRRPGAIYALIRKTIKPIPILGPASGSAVRGLRRFRTRWARVAILMDHVLRHPAAVTSLVIAYRHQGYRGFRDELASQLPALRGLSAQEWFRRTRLTENQLARLRAQEWTAEAPRISIIMPVYNVREFWLRQAISSVIAQTYPHWELICTNDASPAAHVRPVLDEMAARDSRVVVIHCAKNRGVSAATNIGLEAAKGDYVLFMDHDDFLEPHALQRCAEAILENRPDMIYSDQAFTGEDIDEIAFVSAVPAFSYDYYLSHPYFVHLIVARTEVVRQVGGLDETMNISQDVDFNLRLIEVCRTICHIPEVLYRWRLHAASLGHRKIDHCRTMTRGALERHFARTGQVVLFDDESYPNFRDLRFQHETRARVAILIPTTHGSERLRACIRSLERTVDRALADVIVLDNRSEEDGWTDRLAGSGQRHRLVSCRGLDSIPAIINRGVDSVRGPYTHYLILSQDAEAIDPGWLEHMLGYGQRTDVGVVGALLIDRSKRVQHAGLFIGLNGQVDSVYKDRSYRGWLSGREPGQDGCLLASRDVSAVSSSCLLTKADLFHPLGGMDEQLAVALFDVDYCLRASTLGYKTIQDAYAILLHSGAEARKADVDDRHSKEARLFFERYHELIRKGDSFYSPLLSRFTTSFPFDHLATRDRIYPPRTTRVVLPSSTTPGRNTRIDVHRSEQSGHRPHHLGLSDASRRKARS